jgi:DNA-binding response OmpR family regulator
VAALRENDLAYHRPRMPPLTLGGTIAAVCSRCRSRRNYEFAMHTPQSQLLHLDGRKVVRILRRNAFKAPIIMQSGHDTDFDPILGLESGANDYVVKPFRFDVLLARIRAQLRQHETIPEI